MKNWQDVHQFWFGTLNANGEAAPPLQKMWFSKSDAADAAIKQSFLSTLEAAKRGELRSWESEPRSRLSLILLLDQFPRNIFRGRAEAFAYDELAQEQARQLVSHGHRELWPIERVFAYLPFEHSEKKDDQQRCLELFRQLLADVPEEQRASYEGYLDYAQRHADIIERFGRFPHRNAIFNRASTFEELEFLKQPGSSF